MFLQSHAQTSFQCSQCVILQATDIYIDLFLKDVRPAVPLMITFRMCCLPLFTPRGNAIPGQLRLAEVQATRACLGYRRDLDSCDMRESLANA